MNNWNFDYLLPDFEKYIKNNEEGKAAKILKYMIAEISGKESTDGRLLLRSSLASFYRNDKILFIAVFTGEIKFVEILLDNGYFINEMDEGKQNALSIAMRLADKAMFDYLISKGADTQEIIKETDNKFPGLFTYGTSEFIELLVEIGIKTTNLLFQMAEFSTADFIINNFLKKGYKLGQKNNNKSLFFHFVCYYSINPIELLDLVRERDPKQITKKNIFGMTGLALAIMRDDYRTQEIFNYILGFEQFAGRALDEKSVFAIDEFCNNILHYSALNKVNYLLKNRINHILNLFPEAIKNRNCDGLTPLLFAVRFALSFEDIMAKIHFFAELDLNSIFEKDYENNNIFHLFACKLNTIYKKEGFSALDEAKKREIYENGKFYFINFCRELLDDYPSLNLKETNNNGQTPANIFLDGVSEDLKKFSVENIDKKILDQANKISEIEQAEEIQNLSKMIYNNYPFISSPGTRVFL